jgi:hypothetical protein
MAESADFRFGCGFYRARTGGGQVVLGSQDCVSDDVADEQQRNAKEKPTR